MQREIVIRHFFMIFCECHTTSHRISYDNPWSYEIFSFSHTTLIADFRQFIDLCAMNFSTEILPRKSCLFVKQRENIPLPQNFGNEIRRLFRMCLSKPFVVVWRYSRRAKQNFASGRGRGGSSSSVTDLKTPRRIKGSIRGQGLSHLLFYFQIKQYETRR